MVPKAVDADDDDGDVSSDEDSDEVDSNTLLPPGTSKDSAFSPTITSNLTPSVEAIQDNVL